MTVSIATRNIVFTSMSASTPKMAKMPMTIIESWIKATTAAAPYRNGLGTLRNAHHKYRKIPTAAAITA